MPNDAKFGLVTGVGLIIAIAVVFSGKGAGADAEPAAAATISQDATPSPVGPTEPTVAANVPLSGEPRFDDKPKPPATDIDSAQQQGESQAPEYNGNTHENVPPS